MFSTETYDGHPITQSYTDLRMRNEPIVEVTQVKGTSETHPLLSPRDEFAAFEIMPYQIATWRSSRHQGSYVREAYLRGLALQQAGAGNPYKFGLIGASDTHVGAGAFDENNYWSKIGIVDASGKLRGSVPLSWRERLAAQISRLANMYYMRQVPAAANVGTAPTNPAPGYMHQQWSTWGASGLAGVWAEENTRESIFAAMRRKETFATSGPRMRVRFFSGYGLGDDIFDQADMVSKAYARAVPMGGDLVAQGKQSPEFLVWVTRDPASNALQRAQIVKGWIDAEGNTQEAVFDVACAGGAAVNPETQRCPENNATVDVSTCATSADTGADELRTVWRDPTYVAGQSAAYYVRALENPTCRWSSWDALRAGTLTNPSLPTTIQERIWSSPIWIEN